MGLSQEKLTCFNFNSDFRSFIKHHKTQDKAKQILVYLLIKRLWDLPSPMLQPSPRFHENLDSKGKKVITSSNLYLKTEFRRSNCIQNTNNLICNSNRIQLLILYFKNLIPLLVFRNLELPDPVAMHTYILYNMGSGNKVTKSQCLEPTAIPNIN